MATPTAATTLFTATYASGQAISRGCSTSFSPIVCTFGPPGGASPTDPIYQIRVSQVAGGWYVSSDRLRSSERRRCRASKLRAHSRLPGPGACNCSVQIAVARSHLFGLSPFISEGLPALHPARRSSCIRDATADAVGLIWGH